MAAPASAAGQPDRLTTEIIRLGTSYQLCSSHTSFVAIERRETTVEGDLQLRKVPVLLTHGWGGEEGMIRGSAPAMLLESQALIGPASPLQNGRVWAHRSFSFRHNTRWLERVADPPLRPLDRLILLQAADGSWDLTDELADIIGCPLPTLELVARKTSADAATIRRAWATALAIAFLEIRASNARDEWALLADKGRTWLDRCGVESPTGQPWITLVRQVLART